MRVLIATSQTPFVRGGAEILADELKLALEQSGHTADICSIPFKWYPPQCVVDHMAACRLLDLSEYNGTKVDLVIGLKFPAYFCRHENKVLWLVHQHREAFDLWDRKIGALFHSQDGALVRDAVHVADAEILGKEYSRRYTISENVSNRLLRYSDVDSEPLYHPPRGSEHFSCNGVERYLFFPSRLTPIKRQDLVIEAFAKMKVRDVSLVFAGTADSKGYLEELKALAESLGVANRVRFAGYISDEQKAELYSRCLAVVYPPMDEDYGYVTLEAMLSEKPVLSCEDAGGVLEFLLDGSTGRVCAANSSSLAEGMDELADDETRAAAWGRKGKELYDTMGISWRAVIEALVR